ncbi:MAG TPA: hypothetical protein VL357_09615 [Rariglobus sp.]|nr:hypothetical protein [Rariglobus sp.]
MNLAANGKCASNPPCFLTPKKKIMKLRLRAGLLAMVLITAGSAKIFGQDVASVQAAPIATGQHVFTCGNSFHAWFIAPILKDMAEKAGIQGHEIVGVSKIGGSQAIQHWNVPDAKNEAKAALWAGKVDVLTLACMLHPDDGIEKFATLGYARNPRIRVILQEFWIPWDKFEWPFKGDPASVNPDAATAEGLRALHAPYFKEMDAYVVALNKRLGAPVVEVAPVGQAILAVRTRIIEGTMPGITKQSELFTDKLGHPQPPLQVLAAYCNFAIIYRRSPVGLPMPDILTHAHHPQWDARLNRALQEIAWDAVVHQPLSGVMTNP